MSVNLKSHYSHSETYPRAKCISESVSVIIPTLEYSEALRKCLKALLLQTYSPDFYEIIVVLNGPDTDSFSKINKEFPSIITFTERTPGSYAARNRGICKAQGNVLAFTDADCFPENDWIEKGVKALKDQGEDSIIAGNIELEFNDQDHPSAYELYEQINWFGQEKFVRNLHFGATANLFVPRFLFSSVGFFDARLMSSGDRDWGQRAYKAGFGIGFAKEVSVRTRARSTLHSLCLKQRRLIGGFLMLDDYLKWGVGKKVLFFIQTVFSTLRPSIKSIFKVEHSKIVDRWKVRVQFYYIASVLKYVRMLEVFRLILFRQPLQR